MSLLTQLNNTYFHSSRQFQVNVYYKTSSIAKPRGRCVFRKVVDTSHYDVVIVGGGCAGISTAQQLHRELKPYIQFSKIAIIEPSELHYYQPGWTLVGAGFGKASQFARKTADVIPDFATWVKDCVNTFRPEENYVETSSGEKVSYDWLVVAAGLEVIWDKIKGLQDAIETPYVCSIYSPKYAEKTWEIIDNFQGGDAIFMQYGGPVKCGGAPQKIMWASEDLWRQKGIRQKCNVKFVSGSPKFFGIAKYNEELLKLARERGVQITTKHKLQSIDYHNKIAIFYDQANDKIVKMPYDILHITPPMGPHKFLSESPLAQPESGWVDVDPYSLQHARYPNIFALGDCASLPTGRTAAAVASEVPVLVHNLIQQMNGNELNAQYDGYTSCPILVDRNKVMLAEFKYDSVPAETLGLVWDQKNPLVLFMWMKRWFFPWVYWNFLLKGTWYGSNLFFKPSWPVKTSTKKIKELKKSSL
eukprot:TRINITY_DN2460_c0_g2_i1.p1 TRINITY_DN2460_c0_g2~~TRINITY_DN2460_c0_g2_i1.p1  ORF type:complete len:473 (-),score=30.48 TRINITY_DN2460_c0_g2_i1:297-1715(-)